MKIKIYEKHGKAYVWNADAAHELRANHRIVGSLIGSFPKRGFQNAIRYLPLQLMPEEATLLAEKGIGEILSYWLVDKAPDPAIAKEYWERREKLCDEQIEILKERRVKMILEKADLIYEGKKRKSKDRNSQKRLKADVSSDCVNIEDDSGEEGSVQPVIVNSGESMQVTFVSSGDEHSSQDVNSSKSSLECPATEEEVSNSSKRGVCYMCEADPTTKQKATKAKGCVSETDADKHAVINEEIIKKTPNVPREQCMVQIFTEFPWKNDSDFTSENWNFPKTTRQKLRYAVFKDLWEKNYYITPGTKFGGDFLVYAGDPVKYHSIFIVLCMDENEEFGALDLVVYGRLGTQVKKTVAMAYLSSEDSSVHYISLKWASDV